MDLQTRQVLVSGAAGWLGINLVQALANGLPDCGLPASSEQGLQIRALVLPGQDTAALRALSGDVDVLEGDLRNPADCARFCRDAADALLFHTAGVIHPRRTAEFYHVNVEGTRNLLSAAVDSGVRRAVVVSSNSPCGTNPHPDHLFDEESPYAPYMHYGRSKMIMEQAVREFQERGDIETVLIRAPWFYGPLQPPRQTLFFQMIRDGKAPIVGNGENRRSMAYVENLVQGLLLASVTPQANGQTYWISDERPYSMNEIIDTVESLLENEFQQRCAHRRMRLPGLASEIAWFADKTLQGVGVYHQKIHVLSEMNKTIACSIAKAHRELGYRPRIGLEEGMRRSLQWVFQNQGAL